MPNRTTTEFTGMGGTSQSVIINNEPIAMKEITVPVANLPRNNMPGNIFYLRNSSGYYIPLDPFKAPASASGTTITMSSASDAELFDPTDTDVNDTWADDPEICFLDVSTGKIECNGSSGAVYVSSVSSTAITINEGFSADPTSSDYMTAGGHDDGEYAYEIVFVPEPIENADDYNDYVKVSGYTTATLDYEKLSSDQQNVVKAFETVTLSAVKFNFNIRNRA